MDNSRRTPLHSAQLLRVSLCFLWTHGTLFITILTSAFTWVTLTVLHKQGCQFASCWWKKWEAEFGWKATAKALEQPSTSLFNVLPFPQIYHLELFSTPYFANLGLKILRLFYHSFRMRSDYIKLNRMPQMVTPRHWGAWTFWFYWAMAQMSEW